MNLTGGANSQEPPTEEDRFVVRTIGDLREVENLRDVWKSWQKTSDSDFDFFCATVRSRGESCRPHIIVLIRNARPVALLVGLRDRTRLPFRLCSVTIHQPEVNVLEFVYGGLLGDASQEGCAVLVEAVTRSLAEGDADVALWQQLDVNSPLYACTLQLPSLLLRDHSHRVFDHWVMDFPRDLDALLLSLGSRQRSRLRRKYQKVLNRFSGKIQLRSFRRIADLEQAILNMNEIARKSVKRQLGFGFFDTPQNRERLLIEAERGWLRIYVLYIEEQPVAFWQGILREHSLQTEHVGFDAAWSAFSPGIFLFLSILENLAQDVTTVDFGLGDGQFYRCFGNVQCREASVQMYAPRFGALRCHLLYVLTYYTTILIRRTPFLDWTRRAIWMRAKRNARLLGGRNLERFENNLQSSTGDGI